MLASALYQTVDGVFVGHFLGSTAFAAVNLAMPFVIINFFTGGSDRRGRGGAHIHLSGETGEGGGKQYFYLRDPDDCGYRCPDRSLLFFRGAVCLSI